eukprot:Nitzschia sp. Nitz4//scaffold25_size161228//156007//157719//NITZ4_002458-RA/size161228-processed-gene-0.174-mRNA-1//1//CDS//3329544670//7740//frame0
MKFVSLALLTLSSSPVWGLSTTTSRAWESASASDACNDIHDQSACQQATDASGSPCVWCKCQAVPSVCVTEDQAKDLPSGVFQCSSEDEHPGDFHFVDDKLHSFRELNHENSDLCDDSSLSISGYMDISGSKYDQDGENKHLFFWMFEKRNQDLEADEEIPFVVWLTGGPGCSSTLALLTENGPCSVNPDGKTTTPNPYSWTEAAHVLWLDQPAGVGFSYGAENDNGEAMVSEDAYFFLQAFFQSHPEYASSPLYIIGESYAGHYVPAISHRIYVGNQNPSDKTIPLNFAGLAIGNGLTNPEEQYKWYPEMVWNNSHGIKVVNEEAYEAMKQVVPKCDALIHQCNQGDSIIDSFACQSAFVVCNMGLTSPYQATGLNPYDIRKKCEHPPLCYDFSFVGDFLNLESTKQALGVDEKNSHNWQSCNYGINMQFHTDWMKNFSPYVADLLDAGYPALVYAGDVDFICNYLGNKAWTLGLEWSHTAEFQAADEHDWNNGKGLARTSSGFTFLQVYDAGHMVPADQPEASLDMLKTFLAGGAF